jgi:hypothetical protein
MGFEKVTFNTISGSMFTKHLNSSYVTRSLKGTGVALVTPYAQDMSVDYAALEKLINFVIDGGVQYLVSLGSTGETATLSTKKSWRYSTQRAIWCRPCSDRGRHCRQQHREVLHQWKHTRLKKPWPFFRQVLLQQTLAGRHLPALQSHGCCHHQAYYFIQRSGPYR